jgi:S1-C subfamily serine protease
MRQKILIPVLATLLLQVMPEAAKAQRTRRAGSDETIVLKPGGDRTVIEIRNGNVYVNGDIMASVDDGRAGNVRKRIIIENGDNKGLESERNEIDNAPAPKRAMLGVRTDARDETDGALVIDVTPNSPAAMAGLRTGDRILKINEQNIANAAALSREIGDNHQPGDKVVIRFQRNGSTRTVNTTLTDVTSMQGQGSGHFGFGDDDGFGLTMPLDRYREFRFPDMNEPDASGQPRLGVSVEERGGGKGVMIVHVAPSSAAAEAGLREGDIITKVNDTPVDSISDLQQQIRASRDNEKLRITYNRSDRQNIAEAVIRRPQRRRDL